MAYGTITGARGGTSTGPYLTLTWSESQIDTANNRSLVHLKLELHSDYSIYFSGNHSGVLQGTSYTYSNGMNGSGAITLKEMDIWVNHNSDGTLTTTFSGNFNIDITWSGVYVGTLSVSGSATLDTIPRASKPTLSKTTFNMGETITIYTNRVSTSFTHTLVLEWFSDTENIAFNVTDNYGWATPLSLADYIPNDTSGWGTIVCHTYNGSTLIGSEKVTFTANVPSSVAPTASGLSAAIAGSGRDKTLGKYIQNVSKVTASFTAAGAHSSTIKSSSITVKRQSDSGNSQTISGTSGTTAGVLALDGVYIVTATTTDSRGRTASISLTITVTAYSPPKITTFSTNRASSPTTDVNATINATWSLTTDNPTNVTVVGVDNTGASTTLYTLNGSTAGSINLSQTYSSQSDAKSYTYTLTITDSFGNVAKATATVSTSFVEFSIAQGKGVGVGKVWEQGALDVGGDAYILGKLKEAGFDLIPVGAVFVFAGTSAPGGYLICNGGAVSRTTYAKLFSAIGTTYGAGDGSTTFNLPNLAGRIPVGLYSGDTRTDTVGKIGGEFDHKLVTNEMPSHTHQVTTNGGLYFEGGSSGHADGTTGYATQATGVQTGSAGGDAAHNNMQPFTVMNYIIKI